MKSIKWVLVAVVLSAALSACKQPEPAAPAAEATPAPAEAAPAAEPATAPEPAPADAATTAPATDAAPTDAPPADAAEDSEDSPHSGGDKVRPAAEPAAGT